MAVTCKEFKLKDPQDTPEIGRLVNLIVVQNGIKDQNRIKPGETITLRYESVVGRLILPQLINYKMGSW